MLEHDQGRRTTEITVTFDAEVLDVIHLPRPTAGDRAARFVVGPAGDVDVELPAELVHTRCSLVKLRDGQAWIQPPGPPGSAAVVAGQLLRGDGTEEALREGGAVALVQPGDGAVLRAGSVELRIANTTVPRRAPVPWRLDTVPLTRTAAAALVHLVAGLLAMAVPPEPRSLSLDPDGATLRAIRSTTWPSALPEQEALPLGARTVWSSAAPPRASGAEGAMGTPGAPQRPTRALRQRTSRLDGPTVSDSRSSQPMTEAQIQQAGILGILRRATPLQSAGLLERGSAIGDDAQSLLGQLVGREPGLAPGDHGLGLVGHGPGGDGHDRESVGTGRLPTIGKFGEPRGRRDLTVPRATPLAMPRAHGIQIDTDARGGAAMHRRGDAALGVSRHVRRRRHHRQLPVRSAGCGGRRMARRRAASPAGRLVIAGTGCA